MFAGPAAAQPAAAPVQQARVDDPGHPAITVAIWAPAAGSDLPLVILSHGTGAGPASHLDTARALAEAGFVVAAPMHVGDNFQDDSAVGKPNWFVDRARQVSRVIDFLYGPWAGHARLRPNRVGIFGFSAGATTALIAIGGTPDLAGIPAYCARQPEFACKLMAPPAAAPPAWTHDPRIAAAVIAAPGIGFAFAPSGLAKVKVPVQLWTGEADQTVPTATNAAVVRRLLRGPVDFHSVPGAVHFSFLAPCGPDFPPQFCQDTAGFDRAAFHRDMNRAIVDFFRARLATPAQRR
ncbi:MAG: dienelactone hydrolase family protein [Alphaproteobacteria bacterium]|nr:dienelactone hydrolase family protein [Alphaproteobacteria bacterium]